MQQVLDRIDEKIAGTADTVRLESIIDAVGRRSFGALMLLPGLVLFSPLSGIPGIPTIMGVFSLLFAIQLLVGRNQVWLPRWLLHRTLPRKRLDSSVKWLRKPARRIDRVLKPRMTFLVRGIGMKVIAITCILVALSMPVMELILFSASSAGLVFTIFGLSLIVRDGLMALVAFLITLSTYLLVGMQWL